MEPNTILRSDALDILFENRNKSYGAYALRRNYPAHVYAGLAGIGLLVLFLVVATYFGRPPQSPRLDGGAVFEIDSLVLVHPPAELEPPPPPPPAPPVPPIAQEKYMTTVVVPDHQAEPMATQADLDQARIGPVRTEGEPDPGIAAMPGEAAGNTGPAAPVAPPAEEAPRIFESAEFMPSFPGGAGALQRWLSRQLRPQDELDPGNRVRVLVRFVVDQEGEIGQVQLLQPGGDPFDKEVLRVIHKMPRWQPGRQNGRPVSVWFNIPVIFETPEQ